MYDMTALKRLEVDRPRAPPRSCSGLITGNVDKSVGSVTYSPAARRRRRHPQRRHRRPAGRDRFQVGANGNLDLDWLRRHLPPDGTVQVRDITAGHLLHRAVGPAGPRRWSSR